MSHSKPENESVTIKGDAKVGRDFIGRDKNIYIDSLKIPKFVLWIIIAVMVLAAIAFVIYATIGQQGFLTKPIPTLTSTATLTSTSTLTSTPLPTITPTHTATPIPTPTLTPTLFPPATNDETLVLIADIFIESCIDDPACRDPNNVTQKFINSMRDSLSDHPDIRVERLQKYISEEGGSELAMEIGERPEYNAAFVMWGNYVLEPEAEIYIFFDIMESTLPVFGNSYDESYGPSSIQPSMFEFKADLGTHWGQMTAFAAALALFQNRDYKNAIPLFDTAAQGIDSLLFQSMKRVLYFYRGSNYLNLNNGLAARYDLEALETQEQLKIDDDLTVTILHNLGVLYSSLGETGKALDYYNQALPLHIEMGNKSSQASVLNNIGLVYDDLGDKDEALEDYNQALLLFQEVGDKSGQAITLNNIGGIYSALGDKEEALDYYNQALPLHIEVGDKSGQASALNNIGLVYSDLGDKEEALAYYNQALPLFQEVGDKSGQSTTLNNIGIDNSSLGDEEGALNYYNQALLLGIEVGDKSGQATTLNNIGKTYSSLGDKEEALDYYNQALPLFQEVGNKFGQAAALNNIGRVYEDIGDQEKALGYYSQALPLFQEVGNKSGQATTLNNIGKIYDDLGDKEEALDYYNQALPLLQEVGNIWVESITRFNIGAVYSSLGEYHKAEEQLLIVVQIDEAVGHPDLEDDRAFLEQIQRKIAEQGQE